MESLSEYRFLKAIYDNVVTNRDHFYVLNQCIYEEKAPWSPQKKAYIAKPSAQAEKAYEEKPYRIINTPEGPKKVSRTPPKKGFQGALLHSDDNAKIAKGGKFGYTSLILNLSPAEESGFNLCACRTTGCALACLHLSGAPFLQKGKMRGRLANTFYLVKQKEKFIDELISEIKLAKKYAEQQRKPLAIRLNGTSDLPWETPAFGKNGKSILELFPDVQFYDYTKIPGRMRQFTVGQTPPNYHLTFSYSERPESIETSLKTLQQGGNVAIVFGPGKANVREAVKLPRVWNGFKVIDGDESDLRFLDEKGVVTGLRAKADAAWDYDKITPQSLQYVDELFARAGVKKPLVSTGFSSEAKQIITANKQLLFNVIDGLRAQHHKPQNPKDQGSGFVVQPEDPSVDPRKYPENHQYVLEGIEKKLNRAFHGKDRREDFRRMRQTFYAQHGELYKDYLMRIEKYCKEHPEECKDTFGKIPLAKPDNPLAQHDIGITPEKLVQIGLIQKTPPKTENESYILNGRNYERIHFI